MQFDELITWWRNRKRDTKEDLLILLDNFKVLFAYNSGKRRFYARINFRASPAGSFKKHDYVTGDGIGTQPELVEEELKELLREIKEADGKDVMTIAAYLHLRFEEIHPFADGNGRVGRTLLNYYLMTHDYPPLILHQEDKQIYYFALAVFDKTGEIDGFIRFLKEQMIKTWERKKMPPVKLNMYL